MVVVFFFLTFFSFSFLFEKMRLPTTLANVSRVILANVVKSMSMSVLRTHVCMARVWMVLRRTLAIVCPATLV